MPRSLDAALLAAMNAGTFTPWFKVQLLDTDRATVLFESEEVLGFEMDGLTAKVEFHDATHVSTYATFRILRGINVAGVPNFITSSQYYPLTDRFDKRVRILQGHVFPISFYSTPGDVTYSEVIDTVCSAYGLTVVHADPAAAWLSYQFYPTGRTFTLNDAKQFFTVLRQKYLIFATDYGSDSLYFFQAKFSGPAYPAGYAIVKPGDASIPGIGSYKTKSFLSRDEFNTIHVSGDSNKPVHNLGFLPSTANHPDRYSYFDTNEWVIKDIPPNLKYLDFDAFKVTFDIATLLMWPVRIREIFDKKLHPSWQFQAKYLDVFSNTEGGAIPSTMEAAAPYTPINVSAFHENLNSSANNLQALADRVDELDTGPAINASTAINPPDDADVIPVVDVSLATPAVKQFTWLNLKLRIFGDHGHQVDAADEKATPVEADALGLMDSEDADRPIKKFSWANVKASLKTYFDTLYGGGGSDPNVSVLLEDDFIGALSTTGNIGNLGWNMIGTPTLTDIAPSQDHAGVISVKSPTSSAIVGLSLNKGQLSILGINVSEFICIIKPMTTFTTYGGYRFGLMYSALTGETGQGFYFSRLAADTNFFAVYSVAGSPTRADTGVACTNGKWYVLQIKHVDGYYDFYINGNLTNHIAESFTLNTLGLMPAVVVETLTTVAREFYLDYASIKTSTIQRYTQGP